MSKQKGSKLGNGVVVGDAPTAKFWNKLWNKLPRGRYLNKWTLLAGSGLVVVLIVILLWPHHQKPVTISPANFNTTDYGTMSETELNAKAESATGHSLKDLKNKSVSKLHFKSFEAAYTAARIYENIAMIDKSLQAYSVADGKAAKTDYDFHKQYAAGAINAYKNDTAKKQLTKAREAINADKNLSADQKRQELASVDTLASYMNGGPDVSE